MTKKTSELIPSNKWIKHDDDKDDIKILRQKLEPLTFPLTEEDESYLDKMKAYIESSFSGKWQEQGIKPGMAVAANQVGWNKRVIYVHFDSLGKEYQYLLANPKILAFSQGISYIPTGEGCLSVKKHHDGIIPRRAKIIVEGVDMLNNNRVVKFSADGILSINLQHEIDHLDGILYYDRINKDNKFFVGEGWSSVEG
ncbi:MAG: peptide deformylase [Mycoplasmataceae bacterium]|nr:peptide deformylase [Mycoplasmataceae bacterium]